MNDDTRTVDVAADLFDAAAAAAARAGRSTHQQLDHWTRVGMRVSLRASARRGRGRPAQLPGGAGDPVAQAVANAELDVALVAAAQRSSYADRLAAEGVATVVMDDDGALAQRVPGATGR